ncbi:hypothetical protein PQX77_019042 [Marasmius sp. AFHP31]|nr:hypothetical protein PQX77_019042 [Marasmius sp. AFHP31]
MKTLRILQQHGSSELPIDASRTVDENLLIHLSVAPRHLSGYLYDLIRHRNQTELKGRFPGVLQPTTRVSEFLAKRDERATDWRQILERYNEESAHRQSARSTHQGVRLFEVRISLLKVGRFSGYVERPEDLEMRYFVDVAPRVSWQDAKGPEIGFSGVEHLSISAGSHLSSHATLRVLRALVKSPRLRSLAIDWISFNNWVDMGLLLRSDAMLRRLELLPPPPWLTAIKCRSKDVNPLEWIRNHCDNKKARVICLKHCFYSLWMNEPGVRKVWFKGSTEELTLAESCYGTELVFDSIELTEGSARLSCLSMFWFPYQGVYNHLNSLHVSCLEADRPLETVVKLFPSLSELRLVLIEGHYILVCGIPTFDGFWLNNAQATINSAIQELLRGLPWLVFLELRYPGAPIRSARDIYMLIEKCDNQGERTDLRLDRLRLDHQHVWDLQADSTWGCSAA